MPHRCTRCGTIFEDGDAAILSGCPNCGWNKFLYVKKEAEGLENRGKPQRGEQKTGLESSLDEVVRNIDEAISLEEESNLKESNVKESNLKESNLKESNLKESNLKESNVKESNLKESNLKESNLKESNLKESNLKESNLKDPGSEVNAEKERVESVRILGPGSYELNLDSLFERKELVMAIKEEGSYALHLPSVFNQQKEKSKAKKK